MSTHGEGFGETTPNEAVAVTPNTLAPLPTRRSLREAEAAAKRGSSAVAAAPAVAEDVARQSELSAPVASTPSDATTSQPNASKRTPTQPKSIKPKSAKPKTAKPKSTKPRTKPVGRIARTGRVATMVAMAFIAGLAVATSLPANALLTQEQVFAMANGMYQDGEYDIGQELQAVDATSVTGRDAVVALQWGGVLGGGLYSGNTYRNNPLGKIQWPLRQSFPISDGYGIRHNPFGTGYAFHHGVDFNPPSGYPIQAIADGTVTIAGGNPDGNYGSLGVYVEIDHGIINGHHIVSSYSHMISGSMQVKLGQKVRVADVLGQVGCTGSCTGDHLHFQLTIDGAESDPLPWLYANAK